jgi:Protein of unknown function (DUF4230)
MSDPVLVESSPSSAWKWKLLAICSTAALVLVLIALFVFAHFVGTRWSLSSLNRPAVIVQIRQLKQLVTVRYSIQRVVGITEPKVPFGSESILLLVEGRVLAGVDLGGLDSRDVTVLKDGTVQISLPAARLIETFLDEKQTRVWDRQVTWWTPWVPFDPDLEHKARLQAVDEVRSAALKAGILDQAQRNAETAIRDLLAALKIPVRFEKSSF